MGFDVVLWHAFALAVHEPEVVLGAGVTLLAMSPDAVHGAAFLAAKPDLVSTAIIGRHSKADLRLRDDASLSLRHVALLLFPNPGAAIG